VVQADGQDLSFVTVEAVDAQGRLQQHADQEVQFSLSGPGVIAAVGNGDGQDPASYRSDRRKLFHGRALVVARTTRQSGKIQLTAKTSGMSDSSVTIETKIAQASSELK
jgi:beta-galactosidase